MSKVDLMEKIASEVRACIKCPLWKGRRKAVPGEGNINSTVLFVGEAPGYWEDVKGLPFVGAAGKVLNELFTKIGLLRESVFITNVVKCRPPENRDPTPSEIKTCTSLYLDRQIVLVQPKVIATLGRYSTSYIFSTAGLETVESITKFRGRIYQAKFQGFSVLVAPMYHPAAVLHNPKYRDGLERDFQLLAGELKKCGYL